MELKLEACSFLWQQPPLFKGGLETLKIQFAPKREQLALELGLKNRASLIK
jgi:hypothetical protein